MSTQKSIEPSKKHSCIYRIPVADIDEWIERLVDSFGYRLKALAPADSPRTAILSRDDMEVHIEKSSEPFDLKAMGSHSNPCPIPERFRTDQPAMITSPKVRFQRDALVTTPGDENHWITGRAGMRYRDLIPGRLGGSLIASVIHVPGSGRVADYVHFHRVSFQLIYCLQGSARLVYEDQGKPFLFEQGDCVIQPPGIRHRVIESFDDLKVCEISSPAEHETLVDHEMALPNATINPDHLFGGQRFHRFRASDSGWNSHENYRSKDLGIHKPTSGLLKGTELNFDGQTAFSADPEGGVAFLYVMKGKAIISAESNEPIGVNAGGCATVSGGRKIRFEAGPGTRVLEIRISSEVFDVSV